MTELVGSSMKDLVAFLVKSLVEKPEEVAVEAQENERTILVEVKVATDDLGRIIGKEGNTVNAIRIVLQMAASSHNKKIRLDVLG